jgi:uncharacterized paraquat-inducible protein A
MMKNENTGYDITVGDSGICPNCGLYFDAPQINDECEDGICPHCGLYLNYLDDPQADN